MPVNMSKALKQQPGSWMQVTPVLNPAAARSSENHDLTSPTTLDDSPVQAAQSREIDQLLAQGFPWLRFPDALENRFHLDHEQVRLKSLTISGLLVAVLFNWMLWTDWLMVPDTFDQAMKLRLFIYTPFTIAGLFLFTYLPTPQLREWGAVASGLAACGINLYLCTSSQEALAGPYLVSLIPIVLFSNAVAQMRFYPALFMDTIVVLMFVMGATSLTTPAPMEIMIPAGLTLLSSIVFSLYSCYTLERDGRQNWLLHLRERVLLQELEQANANLDALSRSDMLTEVANRRHFDEYLQLVWNRAQVDGSEVSLMMIDVDHFKAYNDRYGHPEGDACLKEVAATLKRRLRRPEDLIARFGGEEFIAILAGTPLSTATGAAERVRKGVENLNRLHATSSTHAVVTVSIGVACLRPSAPHASAAQLIAAADEALYQAKSRGRNRVFAFDTAD